MCDLWLSMSYKTKACVAQHDSCRYSSARPSERETNGEGSYLSVAISDCKETACRCTFFVSLVRGYC